MRELESIVQVVNRVDQIGPLMKTDWNRVVFACARRLFGQVLPREGAFRHVVTEQHSFAEVLTADVRIQVFPFSDWPDP
jgi:hypothetical protein